MAILEPRVANVAGRHSGHAGNLGRHPAGIGGALLHAQQPVRSGPRRLERQLLLNLEIFGGGFELRGRQRRAMRSWRLQRGPRPRVHGPSSTDASAASPSPRPMNPKRSVVVALILMSCAEMPRSADRFAAMAARCAEMRGA